MKARGRLLRRTLGILAAAAILSSCDDSFSPIEPTDLQFSIYGYLDVSADTQWIRVMSIRPLAVTEPAPSDATVTLEHLGTGQVVVLRDSVFRFRPPNSEVGSEGVFLHNFWTTEPMEPGATYRFQAQRDGEEAAEAVIPLPPKYEVEVWVAQPGTDQRELLRLNGLPYVGLVFSEISFYDECGFAVERNLLGADPVVDDDHFILIQGFSVARGCGEPQIETRELFIVGSGAVWPSGVEYETGGFNVTDAPSNISNSLGFLGGVLTRRVPHERCLIEGRGPREEHCKLRYDESSATLAGVVTETSCEGGPVVGANVILRELDPPDPDRRITRPTTTRRSGAFSVGALQPGKRYALSITRFNPFDPYDQFREHADTLSLAPGEQREYDVSMERSQCRP